MLRIISITCGAVILGLTAARGNAQRVSEAAAPVHEAPHEAQPSHDSHNSASPNPNPEFSRSSNVSSPQAHESAPETLHAGSPGPTRAAEHANPSADHGNNSGAKAAEPHDRRSEKPAGTVPGSSGVSVIGAPNPVGTVPTNVYEFHDVPEQPRGNLPQGKLSDVQKIQYVMEVRDFVKRHPADRYPTNGIPRVTVQEQKIQDALNQLQTIPISEGDKLVEKRDEKNAPKEVVKTLLTEGKEESLKEAAKQAVTPSVVSDGTLLGQGNVQSLKHQLTQEMQKYKNLRQKPTK